MFQSRNQDYKAEDGGDACGGSSLSQQVIRYVLGNVCERRDADSCTLAVSAKECDLIVEVHFCLETSFQDGGMR